MSKLPSALLSNASCWPSGAHRGVPECWPGRANSSTVFEPSALLIQIALCPVLRDSNKTRLPSGEYCGFQSLRVEDRNLAAAEAGAAPSVARVVRQMFASQTFRTNASRPPRGEIAGAVMSSPRGRRSGVAPSTADSRQSVLARPELPDRSPLANTSPAPSLVQANPKMSPGPPANGRGSPAAVPSVDHASRWIPVAASPDGRVNA